MSCCPWCPCLSPPLPSLSPHCCPCLVWTLLCWPPSTFGLCPFELLFHMAAEWVLFFSLNFLNWAILSCHFSFPVSLVEFSLPLFPSIFHCSEAHTSVFRVVRCLPGQKENSGSADVSLMSE